MEGKEEKAIRMQEALLRKTKPFLSAHQMAIQQLEERNKALQSVSGALAFNNNIAGVLEASKFKDALTLKIEELKSQLSPTGLHLMNAARRTDTSNSIRSIGLNKWQSNPYYQRNQRAHNSAYQSLYSSGTMYFSKLDSIYQVVKFAESIDLFIQEAEAEQKEEKEPSVILLESKRIVSLIEDIHTNTNLMYSMPSRDYEIMIAELLRDKGFEVHLTQETRDGGYDIMAIQSLSGFHNKYLVECKRNRKDRPVGVGVIRSFITTLNENDANKGIIFTTSYFSKDANSYQKEHVPNRLNLKNGVDLVKWVSDYVIK